MAVTDHKEITDIGVGVTGHTVGGIDHKQILTGIGMGGTGHTVAGIDHV